MAKAFLLEPRAVADRLRTRFRQARREWLLGGGVWPLRIGLGPPTEDQALTHPQAVQAWGRAWSDWTGPGRVAWGERRWSRVGVQPLPEALRLATPEAVAEMLGEGRAWRTAVARLQAIDGRWPSLRELAASAWEPLSAWEEGQFERLLRLLEWLQAHPDSGLFVRQLPVPGVDGKWLERHRRLLTAWLGQLLGRAREAGDLYDLADLRRPPPRPRLRLLDPLLRARVGGLGDIEAPLEEIAALALPLRQVFIVENLQTGLAFESLPGSLVFMGQGYAVELFAHIPWLQTLPVHYWGDLDTHGFAILGRLRQQLPKARSLLMDEQTLLDHRPLWGHEGKALETVRLERLTAAEQAVYQGLQAGRWGPAIRLEQERIDWPYAWTRIRQRCLE